MRAADVCRCPSVEGNGQRLGHRYRQNHMFCVLIENAIRAFVLVYSRGCPLQKYDAPVCTELEGYASMRRCNEEVFATFSISINRTVLCFPCKSYDEVSRM